MKFAAIFFFSLFGLTALATADAGDCTPTDKAARTSIAAKAGYKDWDYNIITVDFSYDAGKKTCSGSATVDRQDVASLTTIYNLNVIAPK